MKNLAKRVRQLRIEKGLTITELSKITKLPRSSISDLEGGCQPRGPRVYLPLAKALGVSVLYLMYGKRPGREKLLKEFDCIEQKLRKIKEGIIES